jgi:hypothetical protein
LIVSSSQTGAAKGMAAIAHSGLGTQSSQVQAAPLLHLGTPVDPLPAPALNVLPKDGDRLVLNLRASGTAMAKKEGRLHAVHPQVAGRSRCGWPFEKASHHKLVSTADVGVICSACFPLKSAKAETIWMIALRHRVILFE